MPLPIDKLIGTFMAYEAERVNEEEDHKDKKSIALKLILVIHVKQNISR